MSSKAQPKAQPRNTASRDTRSNSSSTKGREPRANPPARGPRNNSTSSNSTAPATSSTTSTPSNTASQGPRQMGRVKWFSNQFGFIRNVDSEEDYFVHFTALRIPEDVYGTLYTNEYVEFVVTRDENGKMFAVDVTGIREGPLLCQYEPNNHRLRVRTRRHNRENREGEEGGDRSVGPEEEQ